MKQPLNYTGEFLEKGDNVPKQLKIYLCWVDFLKFDKPLPNSNISFFDHKTHNIFPIPKILDEKRRYVFEINCKLFCFKENHKYHPTYFEFGVFYNQ